MSAALLTGSMLVACGGGAPLPKWPITPSAKLCHDASLGSEGFCMPSAQIEKWLEDPDLKITDAAISNSGVTAPYKLRVEVPGGPVISVKFKRAPDELDAFNNSPRRELAAYRLQKLFLDPEDYVVPPTALACLSVKKYRELMPELEAHGDSGCAVGIMAYWVEGITSDDVYDEDRWSIDPVYSYHIANLNVLTVLIGHQDNIGDNFYVTEDPQHPRAFSIDNGLAFGAMGANPIQLVSSTWSSLRVPGIPKGTIARLKEVSEDDLQRVLASVGQLEWKNGTLVVVPPTDSMDPNEGVRGKDGVIQLGMTADEISDVDRHLADLLREITSGEVETLSRAQARNSR
jgi:hypothetical protein